MGARNAQPVIHAYSVIVVLGALSVDLGGVAIEAAFPALLRFGDSAGVAVAVAKAAGCQTAVFVRHDSPLLWAELVGEKRVHAGGAGWRRWHGGYRNALPRLLMWTSWPRNCCIWPVASISISRSLLDSRWNP